MAGEQWLRCDVIAMGVTSLLSGLLLAMGYRSIFRVSLIPTLRR